MILEVRSTCIIYDIYTDGTKITIMIMMVQKLAEIIVRSTKISAHKASGYFSGHCYRWNSHLATVVVSRIRVALLKTSQGG